MTKLKNLKGFKALSKKDQSEINGGARAYCGGPKQCCIRVSNEIEFCDYGYCVGPNRCIWA